MRIDDLPKDKGGSIAEFCNFPAIQLQPLEPRSLHGSYNMKFGPKPMMMNLVDEKRVPTMDHWKRRVELIGGSKND